MAGEAVSLGRLLARRLVQVGVSKCLSCLGTSTLLDHLVDETGLRLVGFYNELEVGYRWVRDARGMAVFAVTFTVRVLSVLNAMAGAYSASLSVICIVGGPNSNDYGTNQILHHTIGVPDFSQDLRCFEAVTCYQSLVTNLDSKREAELFIREPYATYLILSKWTKWVTTYVKWLLGTKPN